MLALSIAKPCHENWDEMFPGERGVYCSSCHKNVIDFTSMPDDEVLDYFQQRKGEPLCGKFRNDQLNRPLIEISPSVFRMRIPFWKKFLAALLVYFSSFITGCSTQSDKDYTVLEVPSNEPASQQQIAKADVSLGEHMTKNNQSGPAKSNERPKYEVSLVLPELTVTNADFRMGFVVAYNYKPIFPDLTKQPSINRR